MYMPAEEVVLLIYLPFLKVQTNHFIINNKYSIPIVAGHVMLESEAKLNKNL